MKILIVMNANSGTPNPKIELDGQEAENLSNLINALQVDCNLYSGDKYKGHFHGLGVEHLILHIFHDDGSVVSITSFPNYIETCPKDMKSPVRYIDSAKINEFILTLFRP